MIQLPSTKLLINCKIIITAATVVLQRRLCITHNNMYTGNQGVNHAISTKAWENNVPGGQTNSSRITRPPQSDPGFDMSCTVLIYDININHYKNL